MGIDYYSCEICSEAFPDVVHYGHCGNCEATLCGGCYERMQEENGSLGEGHEKAKWYGEDAPNFCDLCDGSVINPNELLRFLADKLGQSLDELEAEFQTKKRAELEALQ